jgi:DNA-damage-inducible protein D
MKSEEIKTLFAQFENASAEIEGVECWSARELQKLLGYTQWRRFAEAIDRAKEACKNAGENIAYHFADVGKMVSVGSGAEREIDDILLTRYACYLTAQNGDSRKEQIALELFRRTNPPRRSHRATLVGLRARKSPDKISRNRESIVGNTV